MHRACESELAAILRLFRPIRLQHLWEILGQRSVCGLNLMSEYSKIWYAQIGYIPTKRDVRTVRPVISLGESQCFREAWELRTLHQ